MINESHFNNNDSQSNQGSSDDNHKSHNNKEVFDSDHQKKIKSKSKQHTKTKKRSKQRDCNSDEDDLYSQDWSRLRYEACHSKRRILHLQRKLKHYKSEVRFLRRRSFTYRSSEYWKEYLILYRKIRTIKRDISYYKSRPQWFIDIAYGDDFKKSFQTFEWKKRLAEFAAFSEEYRDRMGLRVTLLSPLPFLADRSRANSNLFVGEERKNECKEKEMKKSRKFRRNKRRRRNSSEDSSTEASEQNSDKNSGRSQRRDHSGSSSRSRSDSRSTDGSVDSRGKSPRRANKKSKKKRRSLVSQSRSSSSSSGSSENGSGTSVSSSSEENGQVKFNNEQSWNHPAEGESMGLEMTNPAGGANQNCSMGFESSLGSRTFAETGFDLDFDLNDDNDDDSSGEEESDDDCWEDELKMDNAEQNEMISIMENNMVLDVCANGDDDDSDQE